MNSNEKYNRSGSWTVHYSKEKTKELRKNHIGPSIQTFFCDDPLKIIEGNGQYLYDDNGFKYIDCINNVAHVGHSHPTVVSACAQQMSILNTNCRFLHDNIVHLAERITETLPSELSYCYFVNSGSEANDLAVRMSRYFTKSNETIVLDNAYHGHVVSCISLSPYKFNKPNSLEKRPDWVHVVSTPDFYRGKYRIEDYSKMEDECLLKELVDKYVQEVKDVCDNLKRDGKQIGMFILEAMQGCGGQILYPVQYWQQITELIHDYGGIVVVDEVQTGFGRVGTHFWAYQYHDNDIIPDIVTMGKPMGNGFPIAAVVTNKRIADAFRQGPDYFNTFGGNPVSCAVGLAVLDVIRDDKLQQNAQEVGQYLIEKLKVMQQSFDIIGDVRGAGLFIGIDLVKDRKTREPATLEARKILYSLKKNGVILSRDGPYDNVLKVKPPLCFNRENADYLVKNLERAILELKEEEKELS